MYRTQCVLKENNKDVANKQQPHGEEPRRWNILCPLIKAVHEQFKVDCMYQDCSPLWVHPVNKTKLIVSEQFTFHSLFIRLLMNMINGVIHDDEFTWNLLDGRSVYEHYVHSNTSYCRNVIGPFLEVSIVLFVLFLFVYLFVSLFVLFSFCFFVFLVCFVLFVLFLFFLVCLFVFWFCYFLSYTCLMSGVRAFAFV